MFVKYNFHVRLSSDTTVIKYFQKNHSTRSGKQRRRAYGGDSGPVQKPFVQCFENAVNGIDRVCTRDIADKTERLERS